MGTLIIQRLKNEKYEKNEKNEEAEKKPLARVSVGHAFDGGYFSEGPVKKDAALEGVKEYLPPRLRLEIEKCFEREGKGFSVGAESVEEIRLRADRRVYLTVGTCKGKENVRLDTLLSPEELGDILNRMCKGSLYSYSESIIKGCICLDGGIRVGVCGRASVENGRVLGVYNLSALNVRLPHPPPQIDTELRLSVRRCLERGEGVLIYSPPAEGKTTLLRALSVYLAGGEKPLRTVIADTKEELGVPGELRELSVDVLTGYPKADAIAIATAYMNPQVIICDEIGSEDEALAIAGAQNCGVPLLASAHGAELRSLLRRPAIRSLHSIGAFGLYIGIRISEGKGFEYVIHTEKEAQELLEVDRNTCNIL